MRLRSPYAYNPANIPAAFLSDSTVTSPNPTDPSSTSEPAPSSRGSSISGGAGIGIGIAAILGVELLALLIWFLFRRKRSGSSHDSRTTKSEHLASRRSASADLTSNGHPQPHSPRMAETSLVATQPT